jgi:hypothetical protein
VQKHLRLAAMSASCSDHSSGSGGGDILLLSVVLLVVVVPGCGTLVYKAGNTYRVAAVSCSYLSAVEHTPFTLSKKTHSLIASDSRHNLAAAWQA